MTDFLKVASLSELSEGQSKVVTVDDREVALFNVAGVIHAIDNVCPHRGGPLGEGMQDGTVVTCPWHGWRFDVTSGACSTIPAKGVEVFEVKIEGSDIFVRRGSNG